MIASSCTLSPISESVSRLLDMPSFIAFSVSVDSCRPNIPVNEAESAVSTVSLVEKNEIDC
ncbi:hypothetical protein D3C87_1768190 [compost metagenome]